MLRFLSNYLFQNENQQENTADPTSISCSNSEQQGPMCGANTDDKGGEQKEEFMDFVEGNRQDSEEEDDDDDWVLIGEGEKQIRQQSGEELRVQEQPVSLVAAPSEEEEKNQGRQEKQVVEDDQDEEDEEDNDDEEDAAEEQYLLWENKLIEHPSMSVYVDLATSLNSNGVSSCVSLSSIAPATSPGDSVIVLEEQGSDSEESSDDEMMDILEVVQPEVIKATVNLEQTFPALVTETNNNTKSKPAATAAIPAASSTATPVQNGRRKKGHYPCSSTNSSQMPRRTHLRAGGASRATANNLAFQMISSSSLSPPTGGNMCDLHDAKRKRTSNNGAGNSTSASTTSASACGIAIVGAGTGPASPTAINKNLKLADIFPTAAVAAKKRQRQNPAEKAKASPKGHYLQESRRRQDLQNSTKRSFVNNDRRSAEQRRVQKGPSNNNVAAGSARSNGK